MLLVAVEFVRAPLSIVFQSWQEETEGGDDSVNEMGVLRERGHEECRGEEGGSLEVERAGENARFDDEYHSRYKSEHR